MRRRGLVWMLFATVGFATGFSAGCSTVPCADICDGFCPGRMYPDKVSPYGGTCCPQGVTFQATTPTAPFGGVIPPPVPVLPGPAPLPPPGPPGIPTLPTPPPPPGAGSVSPVPVAPPAPMFPTPKV